MPRTSRERPKKVCKYNEIHTQFIITEWLDGYAIDKSTRRRSDIGCPNIEASLIVLRKGGSGDMEPGKANIVGVDIRGQLLCMSTPSPESQSHSPRNESTWATYDDGSGNVALVTCM